MEKIFSGKNALVTGASRGIGAAVARLLAARGATVALHYSANARSAAQLVGNIESAGGRAFAVGCDLRDVAGIEPMFVELDKAFGESTGRSNIDFLINNAGSAGGSTFEATAEEEWDQAFDLNAKGLFFVCQRAISRLCDGGRVINIGSVSARGAQPLRAPYSASKLAVSGLTASLAATLGPRGITVNAIAPGAVATDLTAWLADDPAMTAHISAQTALGRIGQVDDIADAVSLFLRDEARWITGQTIEVSGGLRL